MAALLYINARRNGVKQDIRQGGHSLDSNLTRGVGNDRKLNGDLHTAISKAHIKRGARPHMNGAQAAIQHTTTTAAS